MKSPFFIAEVSSNHHQSLARCLEFVDTAADIGCDAVKFQLFKIDQLFAPEILSKSETHRKRKDWELPLDFIPDIAKHCKDKNIQFGCTPFYLDAVDELLPFVDFFKIASYELLWDELLTACGRTDKPVILSTGMATLDEVDHAVEVVRKTGCKDFTLLHCVSGYPTPVEEANLSTIEMIRYRYDLETGWSDHTVSDAVIYRAIHRWQATAIEFHLDLDGEGDEFSAGHCWLPEQMKIVINSVKESFGADGDGVKQPAKSELPDRDWRADPEDGLRPLKSLRKKF